MKNLIISIICMFLVPITVLIFTLVPENIEKFWLPCFLFCTAFAVVSCVFFIRYDNESY